MCLRAALVRGGSQACSSLTEEYEMGRKNKGCVIAIDGKFLMLDDDKSGRPKLTRMLSRAAVYPAQGHASAALERLRGDQAQRARIVSR